MARDMTQAQFNAALRRHGMEPTGFLGYVTVWRGQHGGSTSICPGNAGPNRRAQLAYLLREQAKAEREHAAAVKAKRP